MIRVFVGVGCNFHKPSGNPAHLCVENGALTAPDVYIMSKNARSEIFLMQHTKKNI